MQESTLRKSETSLVQPEARFGYVEAFARDSDVFLFFLLRKSKHTTSAILLVLLIFASADFTMPAAIRKTAFRSLLSENARFR
jgi:hypothetical protein